MNIFVPCWSYIHLSNVFDTCFSWTHFAQKTFYLPGDPINACSTDCMKVMLVKSGSVSVCFSRPDGHCLGQHHRYSQSFQNLHGLQMLVNILENLHPLRRRS
uniref:Uncharacterized protein n=1 Tax=Schistocephalus solidus TaxID=70667 RepID=A0A0V0J4K8_SCHSO